MNLQEPNGTAQEVRERGSQEMLESWKEIAAYLQRDAKTAQRWEKHEGLPIHRHSHKSRSSVYAYRVEIDAWRASRKVVPEEPVPPAAPRPFWRVPAFALAILLCLVMIGNGVRPQVASAKQGPLAKRLVCSDCFAFEVDLSRDGRSIVTPDWDNGDLLVRDLSTGQVRRMKANSAGDSDSPLFSPDRRQIAYGWDSAEDHAQLLLIANAPGSQPRVLVDNAEYGYFEPTAWFPDGKSLLVTIFDKTSHASLSRVSISDGGLRVLKPLEWRTRGGATRPRLSPDGQYIVYSARAVNPSRPPAPTDPRDVHIYILAADGSAETEIVKTAGVNRYPVWTPDGKHILFTSDRSGKIGLWSVAVQKGKAAGAELLVSPDVGDILAHSVVGGSLYYTHQQQGEYVHIVRVLANGSASETESFVGIAPTWSPDGKSLAFKRHHPGSPDQYDLVIHSIDGGEERAPLASIGTTGPGAARWSRDSASVTAGVLRNDGHRGFYRIDLKKGDLKEFPTGNGGLDALSPDEKTLILRRPREGNQPFRVAAVDLATSQERVLASFQVQPSVTALSPDGRTLAIGWVDGPRESKTLHVARVSIDGAGFREVFTQTVRLGGARTLAWDRDGRSILFDQRQPGESSQWGVMRIPVDGGPATLVFTTHPLDSFASFDPSPDGSRFAYGSNESTHEVWALDNVLPTLK